MAGSWEADRRLDYIDFRMLTIGCINRADIMRTFGVSMPQASADLTQFRRLYPAALLYDPDAKHYHPRDSYRSRRGLTVRALYALAVLAETGHPMAWI
jgi:hypothetical protein